MDRSWEDELMYEESVYMEPKYKDFILDMISSTSVDLEGAIEVAAKDLMNFEDSSSGKEV